jgi:hypothetical protein
METGLDGFDEIQDKDVGYAHQRTTSWFIWFSWFTHISPFLDNCKKGFHVKLIVAFSLKKSSAFYENRSPLPAITKASDNAL